MVLMPDRPEAPAPSSDEIADALERAIIEHRLPPGAKLPEDEIGDHYRVGRAVVRGALQRLAHGGIVTLRRHRGASVAQPDVREAREVFEARALLEPRTAHSAALRASPDRVDTLRKHLAEEHAALAAGDSGRAVWLSGRFHTTIAEIADQATIAAFIDVLIARSSLVIALYWRRRDTLCESHAHHALIDAIAANDGPRAEELMQSHLVDLFSGLDLRERTGAPRRLRDVLASAP